jgi:enediyne biosynthesis protein E4
MAAVVGVFALACGCDAFRPARSATDAALESQQTVVTSARFVDRAPEAGIEFVPTNGVEAGHRTILETLGVGAALLDYDLDGNLDILVPGGGLFGENESGEKKLIGRPPILLRNEGDWRFTDVTESAGWSTRGCTATA